MGDSGPEKHSILSRNPGSNPKIPCFKMIPSVYNQILGCSARDMDDNLLGILLPLAKADNIQRERHKLCRLIDPLYSINPRNKETGVFGEDHLC